MYAGSNQLVANELDTLQRKIVVIGLVASLVGETVKLNANIRHGRKRPAQGRQAVAGRIGEHSLVSPEQQVHGYARLQHADEFRPCDFLHIFELDVGRRIVGVQRRMSVRDLLAASASSDRR